MAITVNGALCSAATSANFINKPCVSVTICNPGSTTCQTINDILLDTGSYGLRIFKQAIPNLTLPQVSSGSGSLAECTQFADLSSLWGPIQMASVQLGGETAVQIPIQVIDASFATRPSQCSSAAADPVSAGFTGVLGVGVFAQDCGPGCASSVVNGIYFTCTGANCTGTTVPLVTQVQNPVPSLSQDNNGLIVQIPSVPVGGVSSLTGSLLLGIGTQQNNTLSATALLPTDPSGDFTTVFNGVTSRGFIDSGSNGLFIPDVDRADLPVCSNPDWYCPPTTVTLSATMIGNGGSPSVPVPFNVSNFNTLLSTSKSVFSDISGPSTFGFDWGLPFFMGRNVFVGIEGKAGLGTTGPYIGF